MVDFITGAGITIIVGVVIVLVVTIVGMIVWALHEQWQNGERLPILLTLVAVGLALLGGTINYYWQLV